MLLKVVIALSKNEIFLKCFPISRYIGNLTNIECIIASGNIYSAIGQELFATELKMKHYKNYIVCNLRSDRVISCALMNDFKFRNLHNPPPFLRCLLVLQGGGWLPSRFTCPHCPNSTFTCNSNFRRHLRLHSGERPFKCPRCQYTATRKQHLQSHMFRKHDVGCPDTNSILDML
ncbi:Zinc finger and BTB domain-containing protein 8A.1-A [Armadillidium nasatum]|uniref:Zinc finger and BTB domain-containing protein 8A.1-A n=1 Tax=Armadillidium nasatum TaxID=96803 RepID=A0A5N5TLU5_9CRUS|nr:Zinc finger and BTB domain-containing protein 8A.1-A [Armadillidium nasatum]